MLTQLPEQIFVPTVDGGVLILDAVRGKKSQWHVTVTRPVTLAANFAFGAAPDGTWVKFDFGGPVITLAPGDTLNINQ